MTLLKNEKTIFKISNGVFYSVLTLLMLLLLSSSALAATTHDISTVDDLKAIGTGDFLLSDNYNLTKDIVIEDSIWNPIGSYETNFTGTFDGNGKTITFSAPLVTFEKKTESETKQGYGLFGNANSAVFKNVNLKVNNLTDGADYSVFYLASLVGKAYNTTITNCTVTGITSDATIKGNGGVAGLVGVIESPKSSRSVIEDCYSNVNVISNGVVGGITSVANYTDVINSSARGSIESNNQYIGGLIGMTSNSTVKDSSYNGFSGHIIGNGNIGGLLGSADNSTVSNCYAINVNVINKGNRSQIGDAGGLIGTSGTVTLNSCFSTGTVKGNFNVGGITGTARTGSISDCYSICDVEGDSKTGGFIGSHAADRLGLEIQNSYSAGRVTAGTAFGGFIGQSYASTTITDCYYDTNTSGKADTGNGEPHKTADMKTLATFQKWNISETPYEKTWYFEAGSYPELLIKTNWIYIQNASSLEKIGTNVYAEDGSNDVKKLWTMDANYILADNIDLDSVSHFKPIGTADNPFTGTFSGMNRNSKYTISNLRILSDSDNMGFFGVVDGAVISDVSLIVKSVEGGKNVGALAGSLKDAVIQNCSVENGTVQGESSVGGLVGNSVENSVIENCYTNIDVKALSNTAGGLVGSIYQSGTIRNSYSIGSTESAESIAGGLVGSILTDAVIEKSYSAGEVTASGGKAGGLVGQILESADISNSFALNEHVDGSDATGRVIGDIVKDDKVNVETVYAWSGMKNDYGFTTKDAGKNNGQPIESVTFWETFPANEIWAEWSTSDWKLNEYINYRLPVLIWQETVVSDLSYLISSSENVTEEETKDSEKNKGSSGGGRRMNDEAEKSTGQQILPANNESEKIIEEFSVVKEKYSSVFFFILLLLIVCMAVIVRSVLKNSKENKED
ncbi:hypothetical protein LJC08_02460 [Methanimicrococcus sp. OttesenSCG-928-J09]|nr:hypothetical protein [Methanimicrococcus sp. OttesenSCG-928-J09]